MLSDTVYKASIVAILLTTNSQQVLATKLSKCPGLYCGRITLSSLNQSVTYSDCGACPRGYKSDGYICRKCTSDLSLYDWLYLGFMVFLIPVMNCHFINFFEPKKRLIGILHLTAVIEAFVSAFVALLVMEPIGKLSLKTCKVASVKDWYTVFFNPKPDYVHVIQCTQEAVYPLFTIVFVYHANCLLLSLTARPIVLCFLKGIPGKRCIYASMYLLPILSVAHAIFAGVIYYSFPFLILVASSIGSAVYLSIKSEHLWRLWRNIESILVLTTYCLANAYGLISLTQFKEPIRDSILLLLICLPTFFYFLTFRLTDPRKFT